MALTTKTGVENLNKTIKNAQLWITYLLPVAIDMHEYLIDC